LGGSISIEKEKKTQVPLHKLKTAPAVRSWAKLSIPGPVTLETTEVTQ